MYKRIYKNMQLLTLFTLIISIILILLVCYTNFNARLKSEIKNETLISKNETVKEFCVRIKNRAKKHTQQLNIILQNSRIL